MVLDTSALFKRFVDEPGRERVLAVMASAETLMAAPHCKLELHSALVRLGREGRLDEALLRTTREAIELSFEEVDILPFTPSLERAAIRALEAGPLRAMDALHVATALIGRADLFVTADRRQAEAAVASGLKTQLIEA
jgi:predicted nucleic acid-binding protein